MSRTLALLHGFTGSPASWSAVMAELSGDVRLMPLPVLGHDPALLTARAPTFEGEVDRLAARIRSVERGPIEVAGYSLGGRLALGLLVRHPALVARAFIFSAHPGLGAEVERQERRTADAVWTQLLRERGIEAFVSAWEAQPLFADQAALPEEVRVAQRKARRGHDAAGLAMALDALGLAAMPDWRPSLARTTQPVLFAAGERDAKFLALAKEMAGLTPRGSCRALAGAGHNVLLEKPREVAALLMEVDT